MDDGPVWRAQSIILNGGFEIWRLHEDRAKRTRELTGRGDYIQPSMRHPRSCPTIYACLSVGQVYFLTVINPVTNHGRGRPASIMLSSNLQEDVGIGFHKFNYGP
jgi:hypothetical protein